MSELSRHGVAMSGSENSDRKSIRARRKVVSVKTPLRSVSEMEEGMNNTLTMEQQQALEIAMNAEKEEREELARKEAELKEKKKKLFVHHCAQHIIWVALLALRSCTNSCGQR